MVGPPVGGDRGRHGGGPGHYPGLDLGQGPVEGHVAIVVDVVGLVAGAGPDGGGPREPVECGRGGAVAAVHRGAAVAVGTGRGEGGAILRYHVGRHVGHLCGAHRRGEKGACDGKCKSVGCGGKKKNTYVMSCHVMS